MHENSLLLFKKYALPYLDGEKRVLEIGPDGFPSTFANASGGGGEWDTLDLTDDERLTYPGSGEYSFPAPSNHYDVVLSGQVIEHVRKVWLWIKEVARVTKPGGVVITINPVSWPHHDAPVDCWRIFPEGMRALYDEAGLTVELSRFESLEDPGRKRYIPGRSRTFQRVTARRFYRLLGPLGLPVERAYDTVTVGLKPAG